MPRHGAPRFTSTSTAGALSGAPWSPSSHGTSGPRAQVTHCAFTPPASSHPRTTGLKGTRKALARPKQFVNGGWEVICWPQNHPLTPVPLGVPVPV